MSEKLTRAATRAAGCVKCGAPLAQPGRGRPRLYCGDLCRQASAYEIRRIRRLLSSLAAEASYYRSLPDNEITRYMHGTAWKDRLKQTEARIAAAEARLGLLLEKPRGVPLGVPRGDE
jgi:hypothetical protein